MNGSARYLAVLDSLREFFRDCPMNSEMSSIQLTADGHPQVIVRLRATDPALIAAGIVEWRRTLARGNTWAWRTPCGTEIHVATTGHAPEDTEVPITVVAGPVPNDCGLDHDLEPGRPDELGDDTLYQWLGNEIATTWPFGPLPHGATT
ncbi:hypothetical protein BLA60_14230 [Actinophytocola xinjiangensis]|uniref:Uncharacterized protein n=1 Tax=Actinophytocola xinjiangensis TaxID=485602 RepID=A0A7Z0WNT8_9PSEU|nr:hypothetical protein [Actinophytocola xinjiangensis]OLF11141.1 hypothetical protein BLA60_14230 [Actinophytocola xinjiangensis]